MTTPASTAPTVLLDAEQIGRTLRRMAHEIVEREGESLDRLALVGIYTRGVTLARRLAALLAEIAGVDVPVGALDITFYRDDMGLRSGETRAHPQPVVKASSLDFPLDGATVVIVDDVLYTGRTVRAAIEAVFDYGRPGAGAPRGALRSRPPRAADPRRRGRQEPADLALRARARAPRRGRRRRRGRARGRVMIPALLEPALATNPGARHLLSSEDLDRASVERLLELAASFEAVAEREVKKLPTLRGRTVLSVFFEASTRTSSSFELAAKRLSADTISLKASGSSVEKGETLKDTLLTLDAYGPDVVVIRHAQVGAAALATRYTRAAVVNAGDGAHQHPTQSLLDLYAMRAALGRVEGVHVAIVGDVLHSRVARSNLALLLACGARVTLVGPPSLIPRGIEATGVSVSLRHRRHRERRRRLRAAHAARAHAAGRGLRAEPARVHAALRHQRRAPAARARSSCTRGR